MSSVLNGGFSLRPKFRVARTLCVRNKDSDRGSFPDFSIATCHHSWARRCAFFGLVLPDIAFV